MISISLVQAASWVVTLGASEARGTRSFEQAGVRESGRTPFSRVCPFCAREPPGEPHVT